MKILAIETSCDETSVAILTTGSSADADAHALTHITASQIDVHRLTGGIVPEVAAREHVQVMAPLVEQALDEAGITGTDLDRIAVTAGPGLITSLMVGVETARTLGYMWNVPVFPINHIEGHLAANWISSSINDITFPAVGLIVSGGHTELLYMEKPGSYELIGVTRDDAAGECFDKCARVLGLQYPGGPEISKLAMEGNATAIDFPRPMLNRNNKQDNLDFSFSGLKTAVLYYMKEHPNAHIPDVCASLEQAIVDVLITKTKRAVQKYGAKSVLLGGGVTANTLLRNQCKEVMQSIVIDDKPVELHIPEPEYCTDNSAMIAAACTLHDTPHQNGTDSKLFEFKADPNWEVTPR